MVRSLPTRDKVKRSDHLSIAFPREHIGPTDHGQDAEIERAFLLGFQVFAHRRRSYRWPPEADGPTGTRCKQVPVGKWDDSFKTCDKIPLLN